MSYTYEYTEGLKQFGMVHLILRINNSDNNLPEINIPIILNEVEYKEEKLNQIANSIIESYNKPTPVEEPILVEETVPVEETLNNN